MTEEIDETDSLLLNMMSGLKTEDLTSREIGLLEVRFGENWFEELGYTESEDYRPPTMKQFREAMVKRNARIRNRQ